MHGNQIRALRVGRIRYVLIRVEGVVAATDHATGKVAHDRLCLEVKVSEHSIRLPSTKQANGIGVNVRVEKGHCPTGT